MKAEELLKLKEKLKEKIQKEYEKCWDGYKGAKADGILSFAIEMRGKRKEAHFIKEMIDNVWLGTGHRSVLDKETKEKLKEEVKKMRAGVKYCPFCGSEDIETFYQNYCGDLMFWVHCQDCGYDMRIKDIKKE